MFPRPGNGRQRLLRRLQLGPKRNRDNESVRRRRRATLELKRRNQKRAMLRDQKKVSAHVTSTSFMPQSPSRLVSQSAGIKKEIGSKASLRACSARIEKFPSDDQYLQARRDSDKFDTQEPEKLTAHVTTSKPRSPEISIATQLRSSSKMRFLHYKRKALKNKLVMIKHKAISTT